MLDEIAVRAGLARPLELRGGHDRVVHDIGGEIEKEGRVLRFFDELDRLRGETRGRLDVPAHVGDSGGDRVLSLARDHDLRVGVLIRNAVVLDVDGRHEQQIGRHPEEVIEPGLERARLERRIPVGVLGRADAEVPFADAAGLVSGAFQEGWYGGPV